MHKQRDMLVKQLRDQINSDDITKTLIGHLGADQESFINEHMKRHRDVADIIRMNLAAQERIFEWVTFVVYFCQEVVSPVRQEAISHLTISSRAVTEENAKKAHTRQAAQELKKQ